MGFDPLQFAILAVPLLVAITLHEAAHAYVAWRLGDDTAYLAGRVSLNPLRHIDPFGTILLPGLLLLAGAPPFGWAKPVPIQLHRMREPRRALVLVALAGPAANLLIALGSAWLLHLLSLTGYGADLPWLTLMLATSIWINALLAVFNMLPLPPLDGGRVAVGLLPVWAAIPLARMERVGLPLLLTLFMLPALIGHAMNSSFNVFGTIVGQPAAWLSGGILRLFDLV